MSNVYNSFLYGTDPTINFYLNKINAMKKPFVATGTYTPMTQYHCSACNDSGYVVCTVWCAVAKENEGSYRIKCPQCNIDE